MTKVTDLATYLLTRTRGRKRCLPPDRHPNEGTPPPDSYSAARMFRLPKMFFKHWVGGRDSPSKNDLFYGEHESPRSCFSNLSRDWTCQQRTSPPLSFSGLFGRFCDRSLTVPFSFPPFPDRSLKVSLNKPCLERYRFPRSLTVPFSFPSSPPLKGGPGNGLRGDKRVGVRGTRKDHEKRLRYILKGLARGEWAGA